MQLSSLLQINCLTNIKFATILIVQNIYIVHISRALPSASWRRATATNAMCALGGLSFEPFLSWIYKIMLAYQDKFHDPDALTFKDNRFSKGYYTKKVN